jgi:excisionase family DNA binding protein
MTNLTKAEETARAVGLSRAKLYRGAKANKIPHYRCDGALRFDVEEVRAWVKAQASKRCEQVGV